MSNSNDDFHEKNIELAYKVICEFEKTSYENLFEENGQVFYQIDKESFLELENNDNVDNSIFEPIKYPSYKNLFNKRYKNMFNRNIKAIKVELLKEEIGAENLLEVINQDKQLRLMYLESIKEIDLDNDGVPNRIDIDDTRNSVQTIADLSAVNNSTDKETEEKNKKRNEPELT